MRSMYLSIAVIIALAPSFASAATMAELQAQFQSLMAQITALQSQQISQPQTPQASAAICPSLMRNLSRGSRGADVTQLQQFLISQNLLAADSATGFFGSMTESAVKQFRTI